MCIIEIKIGGYGVGVFIDITGQRFGRWTVLKKTEVNKRSNEMFWLCRCDCGTLAIVSGYSLRSGGSKSCGCLRAEMRGYSKIKICKIDGCDKPTQAVGFCSMHYSRVRSGIKDMRPDRLPNIWKPDDPRRRENKGCKIDGCDKPHYAKGFCLYHYGLTCRNGVPLTLKEIPKPKCSVYDCENEATSHKSGYCAFHLLRLKRGVSLTKPKGIRGKLNPNWNGGKSDYPNHYQMKKNRLIALERDNYTCHFCKNSANQIHHLDLSKTNHNLNNLVACCHKCNMASEHRKKHNITKYTEIYGKNLKQISKTLNIPYHKVIQKHRNRTLQYLM